MLKNLLLNFGLNEKSAEIYLAVLENGKCLIEIIAKKVNLPRTSVFGFLKTLQDLGLIIVEKNPKQTLYSVGDPKIFSELILKEKATLEHKSIETFTLIDLIKPYISNSPYKSPEVVYREGKRNVEKLLFEYQPLWNLSYKEINHFTMWGYQDHSFVENYQKWHQLAWENRDAKQKICLFSNKQGVLQQKKRKILNREIKALPKNISLESSIWIHGNYVLIAQTRADPHYALLIKDATLAQNLRTIFKLLWELTN